MPEQPAWRRKKMVGEADEAAVHPFTGRLDVREDAGSAATSVLKVVLLLGVPAVLAFDALSCAVNSGLADGVAEGAARHANNVVPENEMTDRAVHERAGQYLTREDPAYAVVPETVQVDPHAGTITLGVQRTAPTVVFKYAGFSQRWTHVEGSGTVTYR